MICNDPQLVPWSPGCRWMDEWIEITALGYNRVSSLSFSVSSAHHILILLPLVPRVAFCLPTEGSQAPRASFFLRAAPRRLPRLCFVTVGLWGNKSAFVIFFAVYQLVGKHLQVGGGK